MPNHPITSYNKSTRLFALYQCLPRDEASAISLSELMTVYGYDAHKFDNERKNLENDLTSLNQIFNDVFHSDALKRLPEWGSNIRGKTARFYIEPSFSIDIINEQTVFFWQMLANYTANYLPATLKQSIDDKLTQLDRQDKRSFNQSQLGQWQSHIITLPSVIQAPALDKEIMAQIHHALLSNQQLAITYQKKWNKHADVRIVYPKGLVFIDNMIYLTGFYPKEDDIDDQKLLKAHRNFAVNRIKKAKVIAKSIPDWVGRDAFTLENLRQLGKLEFNDDLKISLVLKVQKYACQHLYERPLSFDQTIIVIDDTWNEVHATVANTQRLQDWLVSMSQLSVVMEPVELKAVVYERLQSGIALYEEETDKNINVNH
ncbi:helix-turn-helix transcriptional regulator [Psychrobacter jeotgali]|uniref:helix-turn-helix transcriptional regulator n=1 Tax=Psychrobacter jeotgali TaxID=179010 RepID=UPI0019188B83|nr:WYL domain-containing protein [Psychrobacter jeotgali]